MIWDFFNGEQITSLQKPKIDLMILFCEILRVITIVFKMSQLL